MAVPFLPQLAYMFRDTSPAVLAPYGGELAAIEGADPAIPPPKENRIVIPIIGINEPILEGRGIGVISQGGTWRRPNTSTPQENNNTVIVGHRFYGSNASTFYHLDKVPVGHRFAVYWEGEEVLYEVTQTKIVAATAVEIEAPTQEAQLTLYTCHPVWTAKERLVIVAKPVVSRSNI